MLTSKRLKSLLLSSVFIIAPSFVSAETYEIDASHSTVGFKIRHLAISNVAGIFSKFSGTFNYDHKDLEKSSTEATIEVASVDTNELKRDDHLRNPDFFDASKFPKMTFKSSKVTKVSDSTFKVDGDLTIKDITKPVSLTVEKTGEAVDPWGNQRVAFNATTKINRKEFGLTWSKLLETGALVVGEEVTINIDIEGIKKK